MTAQDISKTYGATPLFRGIAFTIAEGDRIGLIGPNGSGKSTLLQVLSGPSSQSYIIALASRQCRKLRQ
jgi:ATP-binding cassette subfamily F protein uup